MSDSFKTVLIKDARIADITSQECYGVVSGGSQSTQNQITATSKSTSSIVFQVQVPSENIVIDRNIMIQASLDFNIEILGGDTIVENDLVFDYARTDAFQAFPLSELFTTSSCTINNTNISANLQDILPQLTNLNSARDLYRYNATTPSLPDSQWGVFNDGVNATNNPLGGFANNALDPDFDPRGAYPAVFTVQHLIDGAYADDSLVATDVGAREKWIINVKATVTEPLWGLSPWTWSDPEYNAQGILGVSNMSFVFNIDASCKRLWSSSTGFIHSISLTNNCFNTCQLLLTYLSLQPTDVVETRNVVPYLDFPRFISNSTTVLPPYDQERDGLNPQKFTISSNSIQLA